MEKGVSTYFLLGFFISLFWLNGYKSCRAQENYHFQNELSITASNDNFIPPFSDRYYTNGINIAFSHAVGRGGLKRIKILGELNKSILRFELGHQIYTPSSINKTAIKDLDRPYAAYLFLRSSNHTFWNHTHGLKLGVDIGIIGPAAGGESVQKWWHKLIHYKNPEGWHNQINNVPVLSVDIDYQRTWLSSSDFDFIPNIGLQTGTAFNNISAGLILRAGEFNSFDHSAITKSNVYTSADREFENSVHKRERFLFLGINNQVVFYNTLIEGSIFRPSKSIHTEKTHSKLTTISVGYAHSAELITGIITVYQLSPEVVNGKGHIYASIELALRFK